MIEYWAEHPPMHLMMADYLASLGFAFVGAKPRPRAVERGGELDETTVAQTMLMMPPLPEHMKIPKDVPFVDPRTYFTKH